MLRFVCFVVVGVASLAIGQSTLKAASLAELYGESQRVASVKISPDGTKVAYIFTEEGVNSLIVTDLDQSGGIRVPAPDIKVRAVEWSGPNHVLMYASETQGYFGFSSNSIEFSAVFSVNTENGKTVQLLSRNRDMDIQSSLSNVRAKAWDKDGTVYMAARTSAGGRRSASVGVAGYTPGEVDLYRVDGNTGRGKRIASGAVNTDEWIVRPDGTVVARVDYFDKTNRYRILAPEDGALGRDWDVIFSEDMEIPNLGIYGTNESGSALVVGTRINTDRFTLFELEIAAGKISETALYEHEYVDVDEIIVDEYTGEVVGAEIIYAAREQRFFDSKFISVLGAAEKALPEGYRVYIESWDQDRKRFVLFAQSDTDAGMYLALDIEKGSLELIARAYANIKNANLSPVKPFVYKARDGVSLQGYLTLPTGVEGKKLPLVVMPHGGPVARDELGYDWWQQFMAAHGYAVLQMNFRGSFGYGSNFILAGYEEWGGAMQDDVTDGVKYLIDEGIADADRVCIVGASYGGYSALAGAAFTPDLYQCAFSYSGVSDLGRMLNWERKRYGAKSSTYALWKYRIGEPGDEVDARSPVNSVDQINADIMLIHGDDDTVVDIEQSEVMAKALKKADKSYEFIELDGEDHWLSTEKTRIAMLEALGGFLAEHLGPGAKPDERAAAN